MLSSLGILQCYTEFDIRNITMLEKLLGGGSFDGFIGHLICRHVTFPTSFGGFGLFSIIRTITPTFLGYWALIILALAIRF
jgi:hypothetical protein